MVIDLLLVAAGLALLAVAADQLVLGSSRLAVRLRVSPVVVGVVVIGLGTSAPEFLVSGLAAAGGRGGLAVGNLVGSNVLNVTLILGVAALVAPVAVRSGVVGREVPAAVVAVAIFAVAARAGLGPVAAVALLAAFVAAVLVLLRWARTGADPALDDQVEEFVGEEPPAPAHRAGVEAVRALLGLAAVLAGAQVLVTGAAGVAVRLGVPELIVGFLLLAIGTSLPELVTSVQAQRRGETDLMVGNLFGSNLFNGLAGGAIVGFASAGGPAPRTGTALVVTMVLVMLLAWALLRRGLRLTRAEAVVLMVTYLLTLPLLPR